MKGPRRFWLHDNGTITLKKPEPMTLDWLELVQLCELEKLQKQINMLIDCTKQYAKECEFDDDRPDCWLAQDTLEKLEKLND